VQLVTRWQGAVTTGTLSNWRSQGRGPTFVKIGRSIRYPLASLQAYEAAATRGEPPTDGAGVSA
jgi:hypothetical protein